MVTLEKETGGNVAIIQAKSLPPGIRVAVAVSFLKISDTWDRGVPVQESFCWQNALAWRLHESTAREPKSE